MSQFLWHPATALELSTNRSSTIPKLLTKQVGIVPSVWSARDKMEICLLYSDRWFSSAGSNEELPENSIPLFALKRSDSSCIAFVHRQGFTSLLPCIFTQNELTSWHSPVQCDLLYFLRKNVIFIEKRSHFPNVLSLVRIILRCSRK